MKTITKTEVTQTRTLTTYTCDGCGKDIPEENGMFETDTVELVVRKQTTVRVELKAENRKSYPGSGYSSAEEVDCCLECWNTKIKPALEALGFKVRNEDSSW